MTLIFSISGLQMWTPNFTVTHKTWGFIKLLTEWNLFFPGLFRRGYLKTEDRLTWVRWFQSGKAKLQLLKIWSCKYCNILDKILQFLLNINILYYLINNTITRHIALGRNNDAFYNSSRYAVATEWSGVNAFPMVLVHSLFTARCYCKDIFFFFPWKRTRSIELLKKIKVIL